MADFSPYFAVSNATRRFPTFEEQQQGFGCGPADRDLFNGIIYRLEAELGHLIEFAGIEPTNDRFTQVREAIQSLIPNFQDNNTFLSAVNGDTNGGPINPDGSRRFILSRSDGVVWQLQLPIDDKIKDINGNSSGGVINPNGSRRFVIKTESNKVWQLQLPESERSAHYVWGSSGSVFGSGILTSGQSQLQKQDPEGVFTHSSTGVTVNRTGNYLICNQSGTNDHAAVHDNFTPCILKNGDVTMGYSGGGTPYPQNHTYVDMVGTFATAHAVCRLSAGDKIRGAISASASANWKATEGYIIFLGS